MGEKYFWDQGHPRFLGSALGRRQIPGVRNDFDIVRSILTRADNSGSSWICKEGGLSSQPIQFTLACIDNDAGSFPNVT